MKSAYRFQPNAGRGDYVHVRDVEWKKRGGWIPREKPMVSKVLTNIGEYTGLVADIKSITSIDFLIGVGFRK